LPLAAFARLNEARAARRAEPVRQPAQRGRRLYPQLDPAIAASRPLDLWC